MESGESHFGSLQVAATIVIATVIVYVAVVSHRRQKLPPGPLPWPVIGNLGVLSGLPHRNLQKLAAKHGGLMYLQLGQVPCLAVCTVAAARDLFKVHDAAFSNRPKRLDHHVISGTTYKSLTSAPYGPYWRQVRRVCNAELFAPALHAAHEHVRRQEIHAMMRVVLAAAERGEGLDLQSWATGVTANNMTRMLINKRYFGTNISDSQEQKDFEELIDHVLGAAGVFYISDFIPWLLFLEKLQGTVRKLEGIRAFLRRVLGKIFEVENHRQRAKQNDDTSSYVPDFVDLLLKTPLDDGEQFTDSEIISILSSMIHAGTESSANTVVWAMSELAADPELLERSQREVDAVVGTDRVVEESDLANLPFLRALIKETFRLHPPVPLSLPRCANQPTLVAGHTFPADTRLILNIFAIHRDPDVYTDPESFNPERFLEVNPEAYQLIPFGVGRRMCPASTLGNTMVTLMVANLVHAFDWRLPEGVRGVDMAEVYKLVNFRKEPLVLVAKPRRPAYLYVS